MYKQIVVGYDGSERARIAVQEAGDMATALGSAMHVVTAVAKDEIHKFGTGSDQRFMSDIEIAREHLNQVAANYPHLQISTSATAGTPAKVLLATAEEIDADVIVVGNKNVQGMSRVLGSVAEDVAQKAPCAVLISKTA